MLDYNFMRPSIHADGAIKDESYSLFLVVKPWCQQEEVGA